MIVFFTTGLSQDLLSLDLRCADFVAGAALCESRCADFVAGAALCEARCADFVAGAALCESRCADCVTCAAREEFCEYYGDEVLFYQAQQLTYFCRQYLSTWFDYSRQQEDHTALHLVLRLLKRQELRDNLALGDILLRYWYRAMVLRVEYLGAGPDGHLCTDAECQAMDRMVLQWAVDYDSGERPAMKARQLQRLYWQKWFGHKTLALTLAQHGVHHWMRTQLALHTVAQVHDSDAFRAAVARSRGEYTDDTHPFQPTTGEIGVWRPRLS